MFNPSRTLQLVNGALFDAQSTWKSYLEEAGDWKKTAILLTGPLIIVAALVSYVLGLLFGAGLFFGIRLLLLSVLSGAISATIAGFVFSFFAGIFGGKRSFALGLAAITLAAVPGYVGQALAPLPWIGWLLSLGLAIYALVQLWRIIPLYLEVPDSKRIIHFIVSLVACIVVMLVLSSVLGRMLGITPATTIDQLTTTETGQISATSGTGLFGGLLQQAELTTAAQQDRYEPPADGRLSESQVLEFMRTMERTTDVASERGERLQNITERVDQEEQLSLGDLGDLVRGVNQASQLNTTEIEVVKSGGGNWAEHQWVKQSLRNAWLQESGNDAINHNFALYQRHEEQLRAHIAR